MPMVSGGPEDKKGEAPVGRIRNTRKLLTAAALIMGVLLLLSSFVTTLLIPASAYRPGGPASGGALAYLAHGLLGNVLGTVYDVSTILILWFAALQRWLDSLASFPAICPDLAWHPVGIRGINRHQRWGGFADIADVNERLRPSQLFSSMASRTRISLPALVALFWLELQLDKLDKSQLDWGPVGSVGFELATGRQVITATSDLDIALFAPSRFTHATACDLWSVMSAAPAKVDVRVETPYCGFSLEEFARAGTERVLVRLPAGRRFAADPWAISVIEDAA